MVLTSMRARVHTHTRTGSGSITWSRSDSGRLIFISCQTSATRSSSSLLLFHLPHSLPLHPSSCLPLFSLPLPLSLFCTFVQIFSSFLPCQIQLKQHLRNTHTHTHRWLQSLPREPEESSSWFLPAQTEHRGVLLLILTSLLFLLQW